MRDTIARRLAANAKAATGGGTYLDEIGLTCRWGGAFTIPANPTDILTLTQVSENRSARIKRIKLRLFADSASATSVPVSIIMRAANTGGTLVNLTPARSYPAHTFAVANLGRYSVLPTGLGAGATVAYKEALVGTNAAPAPSVEFDFSADGENAPTLRSIWDETSRILAVNLGASAAFGANPRVEIQEIVWVDEPMEKLTILGDSTLSNAATLKEWLQAVPGVMNMVDLHFHGNNGKLLLDFLPTAEANLSGLNYTFSTLINVTPAYGSTVKRPKVLMGYGINDVRQGAASLDEMVARIDAFLYVLKYGCTSGQTFTSQYPKPGGGYFASRTFTWNQTLTARPHAEVWLLMANSLLADDPTEAGSVVNAGAIAGANLAAASQNATNILRDMCLAFAGDARLNGGGIIDTMTFVSPSTGYSFGIAVRTGANNNLMLDILHPGTFGQAVKAELIASTFGWL